MDFKVDYTLYRANGHSERMKKHDLSLDARAERTEKYSAGFMDSKENK